MNSKGAEAIGFCTDGLAEKIELTNCSKSYTRIPRRRINQRKAFLKTPHFRCQNKLFEPIFHQFQAEIATFHPLWMNFGVFRQTYDFTQ